MPHGGRRLLLGGEMVPDDDVHFWLWIATVATAVIGGVLAVLGTALKRRESAARARDGLGFRMMLASYAFMTASMLAFAARGFL